VTRAKRLRCIRSSAILILLVAKSLSRWESGGAISGSRIISNCESSAKGFLRLFYRIADFFWLSRSNLITIDSTFVVRFSLRATGLIRRGFAIALDGTGELIRRERGPTEARPRNLRVR